MKYICKRNCYVRNAQGVLQHFKEGDVVEYARKEDVTEHFECAEAGADNGCGDSEQEKAELRRKIRELKINCSPNAGVETMRRKIKEAEEK